MGVELTFIEMFSGIGGFRLGLERSGWRCVWANDIDRHACAVYRYRFGGRELVEGDIRAVEAGSVPDHTLLTAGFPCQSFSLAGKRKGFEDARGTLFYDIARVAEAKRPPLLLLENVRGLLSVQRGYCFARILQALDELGYDVEWQVLNSKHFGVPQNRERVFIVGHLRGTGSREVFPVGEPDEVPAVGEGGGEGAASCLDSNYWKGARRQRTFVVQPFPLRFLNRNQRSFDPDVAMTVDAAQSTGIAQYGSMQSQRPQGFWEAARTVGQDLGGNVLKPHNPVPLPDMRIRRLTPRECERLQGFPDDWTRWGLRRNGGAFELSDTQRYKLLGNAVTVNVAEFLGARLRGCLQ
jgi:DNA (cytosine-5)-methyltransferase 1